MTKIVDTIVGGIIEILFDHDETPTREDVMIGLEARVEISADDHK